MQQRVAGGLLVACVAVAGGAGWTFFASQPTPAKLAEQIASLDLRNQAKFSHQELEDRMTALVLLKEKFPEDSTSGPFAAETITRLRELSAPPEAIHDTIQRLDQFDWDQDDRDRLDSESWFALLSLRAKLPQGSNPIDSLLVDFSRRLLDRYALSDFRIIDVMSTVVSWKDDPEWRERQIKMLRGLRPEPDYQAIIPYLQLGITYRDKPMPLEVVDWRTKKVTQISSANRKIVLRLNKDLNQKDERQSYWEPLAKLTREVGALLVVTSESAPASEMILQELEGKDVIVGKVRWPDRVPPLPPALDGYFVLLDENSKPHGATASLAQLQSILEHGSAALARPEGPRAQGLKGNPRTR